MSLRFRKLTRDKTGWRVPSPVTAIPNLWQTLQSGTQGVVTVDTDLERKGSRLGLTGLVRLGPGVWSLPAGNEWTHDDLYVLEMWVTEYRLVCWFVLARDDRLIEDLRSSYPHVEPLADLRDLLPWLSEDQWSALDARLQLLGTDQAVVSFAGEDAYAVVGEHP